MPSLGAVLSRGRAALDEAGALLGALSNEARAYLAICICGVCMVCALLHPGPLSTTQVAGRSSTADPLPTRARFACPRHRCTAGKAVLGAA